MVKGRNALMGGQLRAARALLNISAEALADETKIGLRTIGRAEQESGPVRMTAANAARLISTLEERGVEFLWDDSLGYGVRLKPRLEPLLSKKHPR